MDDREQIAALVGGARVVGLGESLHAVSDFYRLKDRVFRHLVETQGFRIFALEAGFAEGLLVDAWIAGRTEADLDDVLRHGFTYNMGCCEEFAEQLEWMRWWNEQHPDDLVRYAGTDLPAWLESSQPAIDVAMAFLDQVDEPAAARFGESPDVDDLVEWLTNREPVYARRGGRLAASSATRAAQVARSFAWRKAALDRVGPESPLVSSARDRTMAETVLWLLAVHGPEARVVFGAHNGHLQRTPPWGGDDAVTAGGYLAHHLGPAYRPIGTTFGAASGFGEPEAVDSMPDVEHAGFGPAQPGTVDAAMSALGERVVDLRTNATVDAPRMRIQGYTIPIDVRAAFDALVHLEDVTFFHPRAVDRPDG